MPGPKARNFTPLAIKDRIEHAKYYAKHPEDCKARSQRYRDKYKDEINKRRREKWKRLHSESKEDRRLDIEARKWIKKQDREIQALNAKYLPKSYLGLSSNQCEALGEKGRNYDF